MFDYFGTPKNNKHILIYNALQGCPEKVRKTGKALPSLTIKIISHGQPSLIFSRKLKI
jgi:hypothetical protein